MKKTILNLLTLTIATAALNFCRAQNEIQIQSTINVLGQTKPIPVALDGFTGEAAEVLKFDLYVQGFSFVTPDAAQYLIHGSDAGNVIGSVTDKFAHKMILSRSYNGASLRQQAHAFADEIVQTIQNKKGIGQTKIAFKSQPGGEGPGEIYVADFDGFGAQPVTSDNTIVAKPAWVPGRLALFYTSYARGNPDIFYHSLSSGQRRVVAGYSGLEHQRGGVAGRREGGDDFEQERQPERLGVQRRRHESETPDEGRRGFLALLVAGWQLDLFRGKNQRAGACWPRCRPAAAKFSACPPWAHPTPRSRTGRRMANGSRSRRRPVISIFA